jgi:hypothetical protein
MDPVAACAGAVGSGAEPDGEGTDVLVIGTDLV